LKIIFLAVSCALFSLNLFGQSSQNGEIISEETVSVVKISLARDDGKGSPGEAATDFKPSDIPIHCLINLSSTKSAVVKMNLAAVSAVGFKAETSLINISYKTNGNQNLVKFKFSPDKHWVSGKYRVDVLIDGVKSGSQTFEVQKSAIEIKSEKPNPPKPKTAKRARKN